MKKFVPIFSFWACVLGNGAIADDLENCKTFQSDSERLRCYDSVTGFSPTKTDETDKSLWLFVENMDEFTNKNTSMIILNSDAADQSLSDRPKALYVRCDGNGGTDIFVVANGYIGARGNSIPVRYKFGSAEPISERWSESTKGTAAFLPNGYKDFRSGLLTGEDFLFEITDYRGSTHRAKFKNSAPNGDNEKFVIGGCR